MDTELNELLNKVRVKDVKINPSHVTLYNKDNLEQKWEVSSDKLTMFWEKYCDMVEDANHEGNFGKTKKSRNLCLAEIPSNFAPIIVKIKLSFDENIKKKPYDKSFLQWLCFTLQEIIIEMFQINEDTLDEVQCVVLERKLDRSRTQHCAWNPKARRSREDISMSIGGRMTTPCFPSWDAMLSRSSISSGCCDVLCVFISV